MRVFSLQRRQYMERGAGQIQTRACAGSLRRSEGSATPEGVLVMAGLDPCEYWTAGPATATLRSAPPSCGLPSSRPEESLPLSLSHWTGLIYLVLFHALFSCFVGAHPLVAS